MPEMNVSSFNLDHRTVAAPYVRLAETKELPGGDVISKYDVRFTQPNRAHLEMPVVHSLEHTMAETIRNHADNVIDVGPMGCQTGFYVTVFNQEEKGGFDAFLALLEKTFADMLEVTEVPAANEEQCGWGASHSLEGMQDAVREFVAKRDEWETVQA